MQIYSGLPQVWSRATLTSERSSPLLDEIWRHTDGYEIENKVYNTVDKSRPPPRRALSFQKSLWLYNMSSFTNSAEHRKYVDGVLREELELLYVRVPGFFEAFFGEIEGLKPAPQVVFERYKEGDKPF